MKNLKMLLALVAVLAMAGTTLAAYDVNVIKTATVTGGVVGDAEAEDADLGVWMVRVTDVLAAKVTIVENLAGNAPGTNPGSVHQANYIEPAGPGNGFVETLQPSVYLDDLFGAAIGFDTHFMLNSGDVLETGSTDLSDAETNAGGNPYGLDDGYSGYYTFGMGNFTFDTSVEGMTFAKMTNPDTDFLQVVLPEGNAVWLVGLLSENVGVNHDVSLMVGEVPEPSTVLMLIAGGLCLLVARFRRK